MYIYKNIHIYIYIYIYIPFGPPYISWTAFIALNPRVIARVFDRGKLSDTNVIKSRFDSGNVKESVLYCNPISENPLTTEFTTSCIYTYIYIYIYI
jgi:hypothetical protein